MASREIHKDGQQVPATEIRLRGLRAVGARLIEERGAGQLQRELTATEAEAIATVEAVSAPKADPDPEPETPAEPVDLELERLRMEQVG